MAYTSYYGPSNERENKVMRFMQTLNFTVVMGVCLTVATMGIYTTVHLVTGI